MSPTNPNLVQPPMTAPSASSGARWVWLLGGAGLMGLVVLYFFNPVEYAFYPACQFYKLTNLHCPGCGCLRALHHLTHGHVAAAFHSNPLLIAAIPMLAWLGISRLLDRSSNALVIQPTAAWMIFAIVMIFGILRNLPFAAFAWMSP